MKKTMFFVILILSLMPLQADTIHITPQYDDEMDTEAVQKTVDYSSYFFTSRYAELGLSSTTSSSKKSSADFTATVRISTSSEGLFSAYIQMIRKKDKATAETVYLMDQSMEQMGYSVALGLYKAWGSFDNYGKMIGTECPIYIDKLDFLTLQDTLEGGAYKMALVPYSLTDGPDNTLVAGCSLYPVQFDKELNVIKKLAPDLMTKTYGGANMVSVTPAGTVYMAGLLTPTVYQYSMETDVTQKGRTLPTGYLTTMTALNDGSIVLTDMAGNKAYKIMNRQVFPFTFEGQIPQSLMKIKKDTAGNLVTYSNTLQQFLVYSPEGTLLDQKILLGPTMEISGVISFCIDGSSNYYVMTYNGLSKFDSWGRRLWRISGDEFAAYNIFSSSSIYDIHVTDDGFIYLVSLMSKNIIRLYDPGFGTLKTGTLAYNLAANAKKLNADPENISLLMDRYTLFEKAGNPYQSKTLLDMIVEINPSYPGVMNKINMINIKLQKKLVREKLDQTLIVINTIGKASAAQKYNETMILLEQLTLLAPTDAEVTEMKNTLEKAYSGNATAASAILLSVQVSELAPVFPALSEYYKKNPIGTITITNPSKDTIKNISVNFKLKKYMDFAMDLGQKASLSPGESLVLPLTLILNSDVFNIEEDLSLLGSLEIGYFLGNTKTEMNKTIPLTFYKRNALTWDDTSKIASFITPNDSEISSFAFEVSKTTPDLNGSISVKFWRAVQIIEALGNYKIKYIEDPASPISSILNQPTLVDSVKFPRQTLAYKAGDCDDSTALLSSLLEAVGIGTAIMTTPGHVFLAFNTEEPEANIVFFEQDGTEVIIHNSTLWIPIETTSLSNGFWNSWTIASSLVSKYKKTKEVEFITVNDAKKTYMTISLPSSKLDIIPPYSGNIQDCVLTAYAELEKHLYNNALAALEKMIPGSSGIKQARIQNEIGILKARFGRQAEAEKLFKEVIAVNPSYPATYINLANIFIIKKDYTNAISTIEKAYKQKPDSIILTSMLCQLYYETENYPKALEFYQVVKAANPEEAKKLVYIESSDSEVRAGISQNLSLLYWPTE